MPIAPTPDAGKLLADSTVTLGSANNRPATDLPKLRLVISRNRDGVLITTS